ncbi:PREDICTED: ankyrin repeat and SOCS box protein 13, partial [Lepidothrix coronata]|uniref:Ankyrin repeat and SOCS box protein 13 n=1 Tax=Lepidothrix coronata TaxID=321398 RepID=A0A6J0J7L4_9PASS
DSVISLQVDARNIDGSTPLCDACASGSIECVKVLLSHGAKVNPPLYTASPLHEACMNGSPECVQLLIDVGANLEAHDCHFGTPLHVACAREHLDCAKLLLKAVPIPTPSTIPRCSSLDGGTLERSSPGGREFLGTKPNISELRAVDPASWTIPETPLSLSQLCRVTVRKAAGQRALEKISKLDIPPRLIQYLSYN